MNTVSVIIPICRTLPYLNDMFYSILNLNTALLDLQFIFVNDYCDVQSQEVDVVNEWVIKLESSIPNVRCKHIINKQNLGLAGSRNAGIAVATSEFLLWHDSDDIFLRDSIVRRVNFMNEHPDVDFAYGSYLTFKDGEHPMAGTGVGDPEIQPFDYAAVLQSNQFSTCAGIIRADKFIPFDERARVAEDYVWVLSHLHEYKWQFIPDLYCFYYRIRPDSLSNDPEAQKLHYANVMRAKRAAYRTCKAAGLI